MEGLHPFAHERPGGHRLLHREVLTWRGLVTYYVLFFIHLDTRKVSIAGITEHPDAAWMEQMGRNVTWEGWGFLQDRRYLVWSKNSICLNPIMVAG